MPPESSSEIPRTSWSCLRFLGTFCSCLRFLGFLELNTQPRNQVDPAESFESSESSEDVLEKEWTEELQVLFPERRPVT